jgi:hypothetical protein
MNVELTVTGREEQPLGEEPFKQHERPSERFL